MSIIFPNLLYNLTDIADFLDEVERLNPDAVHSSLARGAQFSTHPYATSTAYHVDDPDIHEEFGFEADFGGFLLELDRRIQASTPAQVLNHYFPPGTTVCNLSRITRDGVGMCLEKAAIVSLRVAVNERAHLVKGLIGYQGSMRFHAFNVIGGNERPTHLADAQHSIIARQGDQRVYYPFNFPLEGFDPDTKRFIFEEPYETKINWQYYLPFNVNLP